MNNGPENVGDVNLFVQPLLPPSQETDFTISSDPLGVSTVSTSTSEQAIQALIAGIPSLDGASTAEEIDHKLKMSLLDGWLNQLEQDAERMRERRNSPDYQAFLDRQSPEFLAKMEQLSPADRNLAIMGSTEYRNWAAGKPEELSFAREYAMKSGASKAMNGYVNDVQKGDAVAIASFSLLAGAFMIGIPAISQATGIPQIGVPPIDNVVNSISQVVPAVNAGLLGALGALVAQGAYFNAGIDAAKAVQDGNRQKITEQLASSFTRRVRQLIDSKPFNAMISRLFPGKGQEAAYQTFSSMIKFTFLAAALSMNYIAKTGWITSSEMGAMLKGEIKEDDASTSILKQMKEHLQNIGDRDMRARLLEAFFSYVDSDHEGENLGKLDKLVEDVFMKFNNIENNPA